MDEAGPHWRKLHFQDSRFRVLYGCVITRHVCVHAHTCVSTLTHVCAVGWKAVFVTSLTCPSFFLKAETSE